MENAIEKWTPQMRDFVRRHINDDVSTLILSASRNKGIDVPFAAEQIEARQRLKDKLPEWYANADLLMGGRVPAEQCSSEQTARFKRSVVEGDTLCDLTGGMGVDFWYMSQGMKHAIYTERNANLCEVAWHNITSMATDASIYEVRCGDGRELPVPDADVIYLDPARRAADGSRVYAIEDCEPNIVEWQDVLLAHARTLLVKLSPMIDITDMLKKLKRVSDVYIIGVRNECKEILVKARGTGNADCLGDGVMMHCVDFMPAHTLSYDFPFADHASAPVATDGVGHYLYEPDVTIMKAQAFGDLCKRYGICQLDYETHLMTSDSLIDTFPGRRFEVLECMPFSSRLIKTLNRSMPKANIATRNFIITADQLRKRTRIKDGGDVYLFGAKVKDAGDMLLRCRKV